MSTPTPTIRQVATRLRIAIAHPDRAGRRVWQGNGSLKNTINPSPVKRSSVPSNRNTSPRAPRDIRAARPSLSGSVVSAKSDEAAQIAEHDHDLATVTVEERLVARRNHQVRDLRREESTQPTHPLEF